ncbi:MAG: ABC transporter substrate-binding protein [Pseudomonadota bacterium]
MRRILLALALSLFTAAASGAPHDCPRIVSQSPYITKTLHWLGLEPCIVGVSRYDSLDRPHTGGVLDPDAAAILTLAPDLLFTSDWTTAEKLAAATPPGARGFRLDGFESMAQIEDNLRIIGHAAGMGDIEQRVSAFHRRWQEQAAAINGHGKKILLLSACSGTPYAFGRKRWLSDLFSHAGFVNVETAATIRHIKSGEEVATLNELINTLQPELLFVFERTQSRQCALIMPQTPLQIVHLDGEKFLHPAPVLLEGLAELQQQQHLWNRR